ncbi:MAG: molybdenum cofactor biosynthesis protein MoaE [Acidobacteriota bacterium]
MKPICSLQAAPIDTAGLIRRLVTPADGAVASFFGVVRREHLGRGVHHLEYHAYREMALLEMKRIARRLQREFKVERIGLVHRTGSLNVGEISVAVAVAAPHRKAALQACAAAIEAIKHHLPVWKREFFTDGGAPRWVLGSAEPQTPLAAAKKHEGGAEDGAEISGKERD